MLLDSAVIKNVRPLISSKTHAYSPVAAYGRRKDIPSDRESCVVTCATWALSREGMALRRWPTCDHAVS